MKRLSIVIFLIVLITVVLSLGIGCNVEPVATNKKTGEKIESGNAEDKDVFEEKGATVNKSSNGVSKEAKYSILYQISEHKIASQKIGDTKCYTVTFSKFLDGGCVKSDGSENEILDLKDYPTSIVTSKKHDNFYYISSTSNPVGEAYGYAIFDWNIDGQTLWSSDFENKNLVKINNSAKGKFPGGVTTSPGNSYLIYLMTQKIDKSRNVSNWFMVSKFNPFVSDSSLIIRNTKNGEEKEVLESNYNRQLFTSFADFSEDGNSFYTIAREDKYFKFVKISLETGKVSDFEEIFPNFEWEKVNWNDLFPPKGDFAYASFSISPDEKRLIAYKNIFKANVDNPCYTESSHNLWVFNLEKNTIDIFKDQEGYVSDSSWKFNSQEFALAIIVNSGCYPDYLDARIDKIDKDGKNIVRLVNEPKSKITNIGWSQDGNEIAYDVYSMDFISRLKLVDVTDKEIREVINTQTLGFEANTSKAVTLLFADWVACE